MLPSYFDYIFVRLKQIVRLRPELSPKFLSTLGPTPARTRIEKPGPTYNSGPDPARELILSGLPHVAENEANYLLRKKRYLICHK